MIAGDPDTVGERVQALKDAGIEGYCFSMPDSHDLETLALAGERCFGLRGAGRLVA